LFTNLQANGNARARKGPEMRDILLMAQNEENEVRWKETEQINNLKKGKFWIFFELPFSRGPFWRSVKKFVG
jgi:hypothetical protein